MKPWTKRGKTQEYNLDDHLFSTRILWKRALRVGNAQHFLVNDGNILSI